MLQANTTVNFPVDDVATARDWYAELLGLDAYFQRPDADNPAYVEFRIGPRQDELGLIDRRYSANGSTPDPAGATVYWHVDDVAAAVEQLLARGATVHEPLVEREAGFVTASVLDPFGNILGLMYSPHYLQVQAEQAPGPVSAS